MASFLKLFRNAIRHTPEPPLHFPTTGFDAFTDRFIVEKEQFDGFKTGQYYPVKVGDVYEGKYQVLSKLYFGTTSTVWLACNLVCGSTQDELRIYETLANASRSHPGRDYVRTCLDTFKLETGGAPHACLVQFPMWDSYRDVRWNPIGRFTEHLLKAALPQLFLALD